MSINTFDIEAFLDNSFFIPYCVSFYYLNKKYSFYYDNSDIIYKSIKFIFEKDFEKEIFYIHNLKFDGTLLINSLSNYNFFKIDAIIENKEFYLLIVEFMNKKIEFRCSYKLLPISLYKISIGFVEENIKIDYPYNFIKKENIFWKNEIPVEHFKSKEGYLEYMKIKDLKKFTEIYCENDCYITKIFVEKIYNIFKFKFKIDIIKNNILSTPSLSFHTFYKKFNSKKIPKYIEREKELFIRDSYFGGRCEVFGNPYSDKIFHFDFPGMYGLCMKEKNVFGESYFEYNVKDVLNLKPGFYNIDWESNNKIPVLPHHNQINNKLLFCNGIGNGTYWFEEINLFLENGGKIKKVNSGLVYSNYDYIFKDFVEYFEKFREINEENKILGKLMINSFYGRTGLSIRNEFSFFLNSKKEFNDFIDFSEYNNITIKDIEEINNVYLITLELTVLSRKILENKFNYLKKEKILNIAIASSIASKARVKLYKGFKEVENNGGRVLYCDTDSIFAEFYQNVSDLKMGDIFWDSKKEDTLIKDCVFISPKTYGIKLDKKEIIKIKGISRNYLDFEKIKEKFYNKEKFTAFNLKFMKYKNFKIEFLDVNKKIDLIAYDKRKFKHDLKSTEAYVFEKGEYK
jgi:hypothetical protein